MFVSVMRRTFWRKIFACFVNKKYITVKIVLLTVLRVNLAWTLKENLMKIILNAYVKTSDTKTIRNNAFFVTHFKIVFNVKTLNLTSVLHAIRQNTG